MEIAKVYKKISGRAYTKYNGHNLRRLEIEVLDAIESQGMDKDVAPSPCASEDYGSAFGISLASYPSKRSQKVNLHLRQAREYNHDEYLKRK